MKQHVVQDQVAVRYADGVDHVWESWEPALRHCERLLGAGAWRAGHDAEAVAADLRRAQYRAHTSAEFVAGLVPPPSAADAHVLLLATLGSCRDTLGVLAIRADLDEFEDDVADIGLHAVDATRDAFRGARSTTALVHAWVAEDQVDPGWIVGPSSQGRTWAFLLWMLVAVCTSLFVVLMVELFFAKP